jgi:hypothetical protein
MNENNPPMIGSLGKQHASDHSKCGLQGKAKEYL